RRGRHVLAIDVDPQPTLATTLGIVASGGGAATGVPTDLFDVAVASGPQLGMPASQIIEQYGIPGPDNVTLVIAHRLEHVEMHCNSATHAMVRGMLASLVAEQADVVLVDMEAGVEHFSRSGGTLAHAEVLLIMVEPFHKSLVTGGQVAALSAELAIPQRYVVANKVRHSADMTHITQFCDDNDLELIATIPWDTQVQDAEARGQAPIDYAPDSPGVAAARSLALSVLERVEAPAVATRS
ncbi:MAG TPA: hypothetical protein VE219_01765, partial [Candidatus Sulfotelmatobacter sp.]|nr:hypothetical protein [Candidatus Sulfotelmatobacter sp.]